LAGLLQPDHLSRERGYADRAPPSSAPRTASARRRPGAPVDRPAAAKGDPVSTLLLLLFVAASSAGGAWLYAVSGWPRTSRILTVIAGAAAIAYAATGGPL